MKRALCIVSLVYACGHVDAADSESSSAPRSAQEAPSAGGVAGAGDAFQGPDAGEVELESLFRSPVASGRFVWIANPTSGRVAYVDAQSLAVRTIEAGNGPTYLTTVPDPAADVALVINTLSSDATWMKASGASIETRTFRTAPGANSWSVSPNGRWAIAWTDASRLSKPDRTQGFQDLTVIDLTGAIAPVVLAVGYRPARIGFTSDNTRAFAVTQDGISIVDLAATPLVTKNVAISDAPLADPGSRDVEVTPDGAWALIRRDGQRDITIVSLASGARTNVTLTGAVTDLDLTPAGDKAVAVVRENATVSVLDVPAIATNPGALTPLTVTGETIGSIVLSKTGTSGLLYTNATPVERVVLLRLGTPLQSKPLRLYAPVLSAFLADDARHAVVVHGTASGSTAKGAFSLVPTGDELPAKIVAANAPVSAVAIAPTGDRALVTERDDKTRTYGAFVARLPELSVQHYPLASAPIGAGVVAGARRAYIVQDHPEGRITFVDLDSGQARTLTGFELSARITDGSNR